MSQVKCSQRTSYGLVAGYICLSLKYRCETASRRPCTSGQKHSGVAIAFAGYDPGGQPRFQRAQFLPVLAHEVLTTSKSKSKSSPKAAPPLDAKPYPASKSVQTYL